MRAVRRTVGSRAWPHAEQIGGRPQCARLAHMVAVYAAAAATAMGAAAARAMAVAAAAAAIVAAAAATFRPRGCFEHVLGELA